MYDYRSIVTVLQPQPPSSTQTWRLVYFSFFLSTLSPSRFCFSLLSTEYSLLCAGLTTQIIAIAPCNNFPSLLSRYPDVTRGAVVKAMSGQGLAHTHTHTHTHSLSLSHTHTLIHTLTHTHSHTHTLIHTLTHTHTHTRSYTRSLTLTRSLTQAHEHIYILSVCLCLSLANFAFQIFTLPIIAFRSIRYGYGNSTTPAAEYNVRICPSCSQAMVR